MLTPWDATRIEAVIEERINAILAEQSKPVRKLSPGDKLHDSLGLSSLDLAVLVSELELAFDADPFAKLVPITSINTVGDLACAYRLALLPDEAAADDGLSAATERARRRTSRRRM
jgi:acyl carrier protein